MREFGGRGRRASYSTLPAPLSSEIVCTSVLDLSIAVPPIRGIGELAVAALAWFVSLLALLAPRLLYRLVRSNELRVFLLLPTHPVAGILRLCDQNC